MLHPGEVGVAGRRRAVLPAPIRTQTPSVAVGNVERGVGENEVRLEVGVAVVVEGVAVGDLAIEPRMARFILARRQVVSFDSRS